MKEYKRLTIRDEYGDADIFGVDSELLYSELSAKENIALTNAFNYLAKLEDKIENGTLIELPCKVGDTVYKVFDIKGFYDITELIVEDMSITLNPYKIHTLYCKSKNKNNRSIYFFYPREIGSILFFTKAEAEAKLKELEQ